MCGIPDTHRAILAGGDEALAIRRPRQGCHRACVSLQREKSRAGRRIPDLDGLIRSSRGKVFSVGRPCGREYCAGMTAIEQQVFLRMTEFDRYFTTDIRICYTASIAIAIRKRLLVLSVGLTERPKTRRRDAARRGEQEST